MAAWSHAYPRLSVPTAPYCSVWAAQQEAHGSAPFWEAGLGRRSSDLDRHGMQAQPVSRPAQLRRESIAGAQFHCSCLGQKAELRLACLPPLIPLCIGGGVGQTLCGAYFVPGAFGQPEHTPEQPFQRVSSCITETVRWMLLFPTCSGQC